MLLLTGSGYASILMGWTHDKRGFAGAAADPNDVASPRIRDRAKAPRVVLRARQLHERPWPRIAGVLMDPPAPEVNKALIDFEEAAIEWAGTGYGKPLVDAAVEALMSGLDTPSLVLLAGAPARFADGEAAQYGPDAFEELGLEIPATHSSDAYVAMAKLEAQRFLEGNGSARQLAADLCVLLTKSEFRDELGGFSSLDDWYSLQNEGYAQGPVSTIDMAVKEAAQELVSGRFSERKTLGDLLKRPDPGEE